MNLKKLFSPHRLLLVSMVIMTIAFLAFILIRTRIDPLEAAMNGDKQVGLLFIVHDKGKIVLTEGFYFHPRTGKMFLVDIPVDTGSLIARLGKVAALSDTFNPWDPALYRELVEAHLGQPLNLVVVLDLVQLERTVDFLGGLSLQVSEPLEDRTGDRLILVPGGNVSLEGPKVIQYLQYSDAQETEADRIERNQRFARAFFQQLSDESKWLISPEGLRFLLRNTFTQFEEDGLSLFIQFLGQADFEGMAFLQTLGVRRQVDGRMLLFPHFNGNLLREGIQQAYKAIESTDQEQVSALNIKIELLNGTERQGLASRTSALFQSVGIEVVRIDNADRRDYVRTIVLDRSGRSSALQRVAQLIRATNIRSDDSTLNQTGNVDVTIILGMDFDGRFVRQ